jgi:hypothetical protein
MPSRETQINALIDRAKTQYSDIKTKYESSLNRQSLSQGLSIDIKNLCENLRSALDYLAHDIQETHCPSANKKDRIYFPILSDANQFRNKMSQWYPGLDTTCPPLWKYLEGVQPYQGKSTEWLQYFNRLNNENKHDTLVPQIRSTRERVYVNIRGVGHVDWDPSRVKFSQGVSIGSAPIDPTTQMPIAHPNQEVERIIWVDFHFKEIPLSAIALLRLSLEGVEKITTDVRKWL